MNEQELINALSDFFKEKGKSGELRKESIFQKEDLDSFDKMNLLVLLEEFSEKELSIIKLFNCHTIAEVCEMCLNEEE